MLVVAHLSFFFFFPKASQQFSVDLIYDLNTKLWVKKKKKQKKTLLSFEKII